jgi:putative Mn2+ efflux pump MntP
MSSPLLPRRADNEYRGRKVALWIFGLVVFVKIAMGMNSTFNGRSVAGTADGIPLESYTPAGAQAFVTVFALLGIAHVVLGLLCVLVLVRYRALVPLMFAVLLLEHLGKRAIHQWMPIERTGTPPGTVINLALLALTVVGLALSLWSRRVRDRERT